MRCKDGLAAGKRGLIMDLIDFYETNADFREYLDKYCTKHNLTIAEACTHLIVRITAKYYKEIEK